MKKYADLENKDKDNTLFEYFRFHSLDYYTFNNMLAFNYNTSFDKLRKDVNYSKLKPKKNRLKPILT